MRKHPLDGLWNVVCERTAPPTGHITAVCAAKNVVLFVQNMSYQYWIKININLTELVVLNTSWYLCVFVLSIRELLSSDAMKEYSRARVYLDENYKSQEHFTVSAVWHISLCLHVLSKKYTVVFWSKLPHVESGMNLRLSSDWIQLDFFSHWQFCSVDSV